MDDDDSWSALDAPERHFDFWLGSWRLEWPAEQTGGEAGALAQGSNRVEALWGGRVLQENFGSEGGFEGRSWSVYHPPSGGWCQTWVDSEGNYLLFTGGYSAGAMVLRTAATEREGKVLINQMVFRDIRNDELRWDWQRSEDGGVTWQDLWNIHYRRA